MLLKLSQVSKVFSPGTAQEKRALNNVSLSLQENEVHALVGRSGSGKSTIAYLIMGQIAPTEGSLFFLENRLSKERGSALRSEIQMIFQDPSGSLNPYLSLRQILEEPTHILGKKLSWEGLCALFDSVELPRSYLKKFPKECSGGELQRVSIARSLSVKPKLLICDEILASLDQPKQEQIILLLENLLQENRLSCLFITHNLSLAEKLSHKTTVLLHGEVVEQGKTQEVFDNPQHPYTQDLITFGALF